MSFLGCMLSALLSVPVAEPPSRSDPRDGNVRLSEVDAQQVPLSVLDGDDLFSWWPPGIVPPRITAYHLGRKALQWKTGFEFPDVDRMYLTPSRLIVFDRNGAIRWLDRDTGRVLNTRSGPGIVAGDRMLLEHRFLHDTETGERLAEIADGHPNFLGDRLLEAIFRQEESQLIWALREFDRNTGRLTRTILLDSVPVPEGRTVRGASQIRMVHHDRALVQTSTHRFGRLLLVELDSGKVTWQDDRVWHDLIAEPFGDWLVLQARSHRSTGRLLAGLDVSTGRKAWETEVPPRAPIILIDADTNLHRLSSEAATSLRPVYIQLTTGERDIRSEPSPLERLGWQVGPVEFPHVRQIGNLSIGGRAVPHLDIQSWYAWNSSTGDLVWSEQVRSGSGCLWIPDVSSSPKWVVVTCPGEIVSIEAASGRKHIIITPSLLGIDVNEMEQPEMMSPMAATTANALSLKVWFDQLSMPIMMLALMVAAGLGLRRQALRRANRNTI